MKSVIFDKKEVIPSKIICIGRNYVAHIEELENEVPDEPVIFIKPNSSVSNEILLPQYPCRYEGEISFIIKNSIIAGIGFGLDLTLGEIQNKLKAKGLPWEKAKAFDNSGIFSEFVTFSGEVSKLGMELFVNGELRQKSSVELMIYKPEELLREIKKYFSLEDYDIIMTGTPAGIGPVNSGDRFIGKVFHNNSVLIEKEWIVK
jgi:2-keto-4-pentenoate hydratase/2-oxohepta-3-ene-1,7-dioic acid hydratase in catechol pathway